MKLLVIGPAQNTESDESRARRALQEAQVERYAVLTPKPGEGKLAAAVRIWRASAHEDFDMVSAQDSFLIGFIAWRVARRARARFNVQVHADLTAQPWWRHVLAQIVLRHADSIRVVSEKIKEQVEHIGVSAPVLVLPLFVDTERFRSVVRSPERMVLWVGRFEREKDPLRALAVLRQVPQATLVMLGAGSLEHELKRQASGLPVEFPGWQDPLSYLSRAGVLLNTSPAESFGVAMVEALAAGVPVVASDVGVAKEAGAVVVPKEKFAEAVSEVLRNGAGGELRLPLPSRDEWVKLWKQSL